MNILFAVQGTGNGHLSRARDIIPHLQKYGNLDILISGTQVDVSIPQSLTYRKRGVSFIFGKKGGINYWSTLKQLRPWNFIRDITSFPIHKYDLVINDFEPITAWSARLKGKAIVALSHQCSFLSSKTPRPSKVDRLAELVFKYYAPSKYQVGLHFERYDDFIHTPVIRKEIRDMLPMNHGHYTVYLPAYDDKFLVKILSKWKDVPWQIFSKHEKKAYQQGNISVMPINNKAYLLSVATSEGLLTGGGFEAPAEALFLGKKVLSIPMKGQYEQVCNAEGLKRLGVPVVYNFDEPFEHIMTNWLYHEKPIKVVFPDNVSQIVNSLVRQYTHL